MNSLSLIVKSENFSELEKVSDTSKNIKSLPQSLLKKVFSYLRSNEQKSLLFTSKNWHKNLYLSVKELHLLPSKQLYQFLFKDTPKDIPKGNQDSLGCPHDFHELQVHAFYLDSCISSFLIHQADIYNAEHGKVFADCQEFVQLSEQEQKQALCTATEASMEKLKKSFASTSMYISMEKAYRLYRMIKSSKAIASRSQNLHLIDLGCYDLAQDLQRRNMDKLPFTLSPSLGRTQYAAGNYDIYLKHGEGEKALSVFTEGFNTLGQATLADGSRGCPFKFLEIGQALMEGLSKLSERELCQELFSKLETLHSHCIEHNEAPPAFLDFLFSAIEESYESIQ